MKRGFLLRPHESERPAFSRRAAGKGWRTSLRRGAIVVSVAVFCLTASLILATGAAGADVPPISAFPPAGDTAPPAEAINDPSACTGWYRQSSYGRISPTASTWWEYSCTSVWPEPGGGATNADWGGQYIWFSFFYWDGSKPVWYGQWFWDGYFDSMFSASYCWYWSNFATGDGEGPLFCSDDYWLGLSQIG